MEGISVPLYTRIRAYCRRRGYRRLNNHPHRIKLTPRRLNNHPHRIKLTPRRLKLKLRFSPKKLLVGLRDAYVNMMMRMAITATGGYGPAHTLGTIPVKEYDDRTIVEIYKSTRHASRIWSEDTPIQR